MIVCGYQGIGKSTLAGKIGCIDLESSNFFTSSGRDEHWYEAYCNIAEHLSQQGYTVLLSSHACVRNELEKRKHVSAIVIIPAKDLKEQWLTKLEARYLHDQSEKNYKAWKSAENNFDTNIEEIRRGHLPYFELDSMDYVLKNVIQGISNLWLKGEIL